MATAAVARAASAAVSNATGSGEGSLARFAQVAQIAQITVEVPAAVARVATVAQVGNPTANVKLGSVVSLTDGQSVRALSGKAHQGSERFGSDTSGGGSRSDSRSGYGALGSAIIHRDLPSFQMPIAGVTTGTTAAERTARVIAAMEDVPARPLSQLTMAVDAGNGTTDRVHVTLRGAMLNTTIDAADTRAAQVMSSRSEELVRALTRDGLEVESLRVRAAGTAEVLGASSPQDSSGSSARPRSERGNAWQAQDRQRAQDDRRQHRQRDERGGRDT